MQPVMITVTSRQQLNGEPPETIELVTEGTMRRDGDVTELRYEETEVTGLAGTTTIFRFGRERVELERRGALASRMVFALGQEDCSLYDMGIGSLMITVRTEHLRVKFDDEGGEATVVYAIAVEGESAGRISYRIEVTKQ